MPLSPTRSNRFTLKSSLSSLPAWMLSLPVRSTIPVARQGTPLVPMEWVKLDDCQGARGIQAAYNSQFPGRGPVVGDVNTGDPWVCCVYNFSGNTIRKAQSVVFCRGGGHSSTLKNHLPGYHYGLDSPAWFIHMPPSLDSDYQGLGGVDTNYWWTTAEQIPQTSQFGKANPAQAICPHFAFCTYDDMAYNDGGPVSLQEAAGNFYIDNPSFDAFFSSDGLPLTGGSRRSFRTDGVTAVPYTAIAYWKYGTTTWRTPGWSPPPGSPGAGNFRHYGPNAWSDSLSAMDGDNGVLYSAKIGSAAGLWKWQMDPTGPGQVTSLRGQPFIGNTLGYDISFDPSRRRLVFLRAGVTVPVDQASGQPTLTPIGDANAISTLMQHIIPIGFTQSATYVPSLPDLHSAFEGGDCFLFAGQKNSAADGSGSSVAGMTIIKVRAGDFDMKNITSSFVAASDSSPQWFDGGIFHRLHYAPEIGCLVMVNASDILNSAGHKDSGCYAVKIRM